MKYVLRSINYSIGVIITLLALFLVWYFRSIFIYICIAAVISLILAPLADLLKRIKIKKFAVSDGIAALFSVLFLWIIVVYIFRFIIPLVSREFQYLSTIDITSVLENAGVLLHQIVDPFRERSPEIYEFIETQLNDLIFAVFGITEVKNIFSSMLGFVGGTFVFLFAITFVSFFFLKEKELLIKGLLLFVPSKYEDGIINALDSIKKLLRRYFIGILIQTTLVGLLITFGLRIIGISFNHSAAIGVISGLLNIIPYVGPLIALLLGLIIGSIFYLQMPLAMGFVTFLLLIATVYLIVNLLDNIVFQPFIFSNSVYAHPLEIFIVILMAGFAVGIVGMFLAIPVYTILRVIAREFFSQYKIVQKITGKM
ncbi:MAG: AI-2E family transporter [Marinilabiliaceae bacterium]|nr:AI-2E family transporter [Marinilabiliaceae bacterium]